MSKLTPMMRQYHRIKKDYPDAILLYHLGDFYEMFHEDAKDASRILNIALTSRDRHKSDGVPLCGIPCHAAGSYINKLLRHGRKVAICEQVEDAAASRGLVKREVTRVITPGTILDDQLLEEKSNNFLLALCPDSSRFGLAAADLSTGEFFVLEISLSAASELEDRLFSFSPSEIIVPERNAQALEPLFSRTAAGVPEATPQGDEKFDPHLARDRLLEHFQATTLESFGCHDMTAGITAAGALLAYIQETQRRPLTNIVKLTPLFTAEAMALDSSAQRNLEIVASLEDGRREGSLLGILDRTMTSMGGRRLRSWLLSPLMIREEIDKRLDAVAELIEKGELRQRLRSLLREVYDLERLSSRLSLSSGTPRDLASLRNSLRQLPPLREELRACLSPLLSSLADFDLLADIREQIEETIVEDPPLRTREGGLIQEGFHVELDELRNLSRDSREWLLEYEEKERERTGLPGLKVGFNKIHGYYIEVSKVNIDSIPPDYVRRQTLVNAERFHSEELRVFEDRVLGAEEKIVALELALFEELRRSLAGEAKRLQETASAIASLDVLQSLAEIAVVRNFCRPEITEQFALEIIEGRHPVVEMSGEERFVPNDASLDSGGCQIMIITGPNMAGKSTFLRQVALITLMAQVGSFVPAKSARIGVVDRIYTRIGASDRLSRGQSTFMVEMVETAAILHGATPRSLIIFDEVGRGTSTFDGLSIAWAIVEHLHGSGPSGPKTLFATHYHHLTELPLALERAANFNIAVREWNGKILFLRKILPGGTDKSYGIQVAQLAGLPAAAIARAKEILANLEQGEFNLEGLPQLAGKGVTPLPPAHEQMEFFPSAGEKLAGRLRSINLNNTTPLEAFRFLAELKEDIEKKGE
jgi:DNA mismatch repair protein MutS